MKIKYELEFPINSSPYLLYQYISNPSGLSEWFAENVNLKGEVYSFIWDEAEEKARLVSKKSEERVKFRWLDEDGGDTDYFFEMKILEHEITKDVSLHIVDFAYPEDVEGSKMLWENQIADLKHVLGSV